MSTYLRPAIVQYCLLGALMVLTPVIRAQCTFTVTQSASTVCAGTSVTLSASGAPAYTWTPGGNTSTIVHTPTSTQTYTIDGSDGNCTTTQTLVVTVVPMPTVAASSSTPAICVGSSAVLSATSNFSGTDSGLYWLPGTSTVSSITVTPSSSTIYTVVVYNGGGVCTASTTVQLPTYANPNLVFSVSEATLCSGNALTITPSGASSYTIMPGNFTTTSGFYLLAVANTYTVVGKDVNTCTATAVVPVTVAPTPSPSMAHTPSFVCAGHSTTLFTTGADLYNWQPGNFSGSLIVVTPTASGVYTVTGYNSNGCSGTSTLSLAVNSTPTLYFENTGFSTCSGVPLTLTVSGASTYTWLPSNSTGPVLTVNPGSNTTYTVTGTAPNSCIQATYATILVSPSPVLSITGPSSLCAGTSVTLFANGASTYTWAPGNVNTGSLVISPPSSQEFTVNGHSSAGCSGSATAMVSVIALPSLTLSASTPSVCAGQSVAITASGAQSYTWMPGFVPGASISASPFQSTTYKVTGEDSGCWSQDSLMLQVYQLPYITVAGDSVSCPGETLSLSAGGAATYTWSPWNINGQVVSVAITSNIQFTVTGTDQQGCVSSTVSELTAAPSPTIMASAFPGTACGPITHTLSAAGALTYSWHPGGSGHSITINPTSSQVYTVTGSDGVCTGSSTVEVTVLSVPVLTIASTSTMICAGESATLDIGGAATYTWVNGSTATSIVVTPSISTGYSVVGSSNEGCSSTAAFFQQVDECLNVRSFDAEKHVKIFPNPSNGSFEVSMEMSGASVCIARILNAQGQLVFEELLAGTRTQIHASLLSPGLYTFVLTGSDGAMIHSSRIVIQH